MGIKRMRDAESSVINTTKVVTDAGVVKKEQYINRSPSCTECVTCPWQLLYILLGVYSIGAVYTYVIISLLLSLLLFLLISSII